jgi:PAP2 superfamily
MNILSRLSALTVSACFSVASLANAAPPYTDAVIDWNAISVAASLTATGTGPTGTGRVPQPTVLDLAKVHAAIYDAVQAIERRYEPYHVVIDDASGSPEAAAAKAAHDVLVHLYPLQASDLDVKYHDYLSQKGLQENDLGVAVGAEAAAGIIALRQNDGSYPPVQPIFVGGTEPGEWRPTESFLPGPPPSLAPMAAVWFAAVTPFAVDSPSRFRPMPPPRLNSARYFHEYEEVRTLGALIGSTRTPAETDFAYFFATNYLVTWSQAARELAAAHVHHIADSARLFALFHLAIADAGITAWHTKLYYNYWRPLTAIREGDNDGNEHTVGDPNWQPLINTPNYPDYTSGASGVSGAAARVLALFFGSDHIPFTLTTTNAVAMQKTRAYNRFSDASADVALARILEGIHFRSADVVGVRMGEHIANWVFNHFLKPVHGK